MVVGASAAAGAMTEVNATGAGTGAKAGATAGATSGLGSSEKREPPPEQTYEWLRNVRRISIGDAGDDDDDE